MQNLKTLQTIRKYKNGKFETASDAVISEASFRIFVNYERLVSIACLPDKLEELAIGFLFSEGLVVDNSEIIKSEFNTEELFIHFQLKIPEKRISNFFSTGEKTSGCGSTLSAAISGSKKTFPPISLNAEKILAQMHQFHQKSVLFKETGSVHSAGIVIKNELIFWADDIGRHNAVDKVVGMAVQADKNLKKCYLICSGRISSEIVKKCVRLGFAAIVSQSAATSEAIRLAEKYKIFIFGFTRGKRFNQYTGIEKDIFR